MSMRDYYDAGYSPIPCDSAGRPRVGGFAVGLYRFNPLKDDEVFPTCTIGLQCCERPLTGASGAGTLAAVSSRWVSAVAIQTHDKKLLRDIKLIVAKIAGETAAHLDCATASLQLFRMEEPFKTYHGANYYLPGDKHKAIAFRPHNVSIFAAHDFIVLPRESSAPPPRSTLPVLAGVQAIDIMGEVEQLLEQRSARKWL
jgi:hypothetical protein